MLGHEQKNGSFFVRTLQIYRGSWSNNYEQDNQEAISEELIETDFKTCTHQYH